MRATILRLLEKKPLKPGILAQKLGISRQALHQHLHVLLEEKQIQKNGSGPHVAYAVVSNSMTRVREDYALCRKQLLPTYLSECTDLFEHFVQHPLDRGDTGGGEQKLDLGFLLDSAAVYSSNIEGNSLDLSSFLNSRMAPKKHRPKEAEAIEDLVSAYAHARTHRLNEKQMLHAHKVLSRTFVSPSRQGRYRQEPVGVFSRTGLVYMAVEPHLVEEEMHALFDIVATLLSGKSVPAEHCFWATWVHLMIALIHPFSDGNGRTARLCEKWFLAETLGEQSFALHSEEHYWNNRPEYYAALKLGANYWETDMKQSLPFFLLLPKNLRAELKELQS